LDNRIENLRFVTASENSFNRSKPENASSQYRGVSKYSRSKLWKVAINIPEIGHVYAFYKNEQHAAWQYNLWIREYNLEEIVKYNNVETPNNFIKWVSSKEFGKKESRKIRVYINKFVGSYIKTFKTIEEANKAKQSVKNIRENKMKVLKEIKQTIKRRNNDGLYIILTSKNEEIIVDEDSYSELINFKWYLTSRNNMSYAHSRINGKLYSMHRYVMKYDGKEIVDHINNDTLDNRKCNLRICTYAQNGMNKKVSKNSTSEYIGVSKNKYGYYSRITVDGKILYLGTYKDEIDAAKARDIATLKYFGEHGNLNFKIN
jgi:ElaB/YqjD/DUF883 family membrane-anchored ribosome-binding protein